MSNDDKPTPESPESGASEAPVQTSGGASVISIDQARAELLQRRPRPRGAAPAPAKGDRPRARSREVPQPVTLPPGEHSAVIVTDTPAARAHVDKKTIHPNELAEVNPVEGKRVRVKTHFDPRRAKTQMTDRKPSNEILGDGQVPSLWGNGPAEPPATSPVRASQPPPALTPSGRPMFARPRPLPRDQRNSPLFLFGIAVAAAAGAIVVYFLTRSFDTPNEPPRPADTAAATSAAVTPPATATQPATTTAALQPKPSDAPPVMAPTTTTSAAVPEAPLPPPQAKSGVAPTAKPTATASTAPRATAKPTATNILPFGKEEP